MGRVGASRKEFSDWHYYLRVLLIHSFERPGPHSVEATMQRGQEQSEQEDWLTFPGPHPLGKSHWFHSIKCDL